MRRKLVCTNDISGHWARRRFVPDMLCIERPAPPKKTPLWRSEATGLFFLSYFAFFTAIYTFIS